MKTISYGLIVMAIGLFISWAGCGGDDNGTTDSEDVLSQEDADVTSDDDTVMATSDGGRTWDTIKVTRSVNTILRNGDFLNFETTDDAVDISRSSDDGNRTAAPSLRATSPPASQLPAFPSSRLHLPSTATTQRPESAKRWYMYPSIFKKLTFQEINSQEVTYNDFQEIK